MRSKKPAITFEEAINTKKDLLRQKYKKSLSEATANQSDGKLMNDEVFGKINVGKYSLRTKIRKNPWLLSGVPASKALSWLYKTVFKEPKTYRHNKVLLNQGHLFTFEYLNPKYKNTKHLLWFDKYPLVLSLGPIVTKEGLRNIGFNLHLVPPKVRIVILCTIFEMYKKLYRYQIFYKKTGPVAIQYQHLVKPLMKYGAAFCIRMYIPSRTRQIVIFPYRDWHNAIFLPSRGYDGIRAAKLIQEWRKYVRKLGFGTSSNLNLTSHI